MEQRNFPLIRLSLATAAISMAAISLGADLAIWTAPQESYYEGTFTPTDQAFYVQDLGIAVRFRWRLDRVVQRAAKKLPMSQTETSPEGK